MRIIWVAVASRADDIGEFAADSGQSTGLQGCYEELQQSFQSHFDFDQKRSAATRLCFITSKCSVKGSLNEATEDRATMIAGARVRASA